MAHTRKPDAAVLEWLAEVTKTATDPKLPAVLREIRCKATIAYGKIEEGQRRMIRRLARKRYGD